MFKIINSRILIIWLMVFFIIPGLLLAQEIETDAEHSEEIFKAQVVEIIEQNKEVREDGSISIQQKIKLKGLEGAWQDQEIIFDSLGLDVSSASEYQAGDKVLVNYSPGPAGEDNFYIIGFVRATILYWLAALFALAVIAIGRFKGLRALLVLALSFVIILKFIIPQILAGHSPLLITIIGCFFILLLTVYITEGLKRTSTIAIFSILFSLIITGLLSVGFTAMAKLSGFASEEAAYLMGLAGNINIKGLLLAGIIIGALGVLDDVVISQVALVKELKAANQQLSKIKLYQQAMKVGISHLSSMVNTLFLAYAGVALPLLILFSLQQPPFLTFSQTINNEVIATEIVRALVGSIGLILAVPIATILAVNFVRSEIE